MCCDCETHSRLHYWCLWWRCVLNETMGRASHKPHSQTLHSCTADKHFCFWTVKMRGMSEAVWELGKCHSPTVGVAKEHGEIAQHSLSSACSLGRHSAFKAYIKLSRFYNGPSAHIWQKRLIYQTYTNNTFLKNIWILNVSSKVKQVHHVNWQHVSHSQTRKLCLRETPLSH